MAEFEPVVVLVGGHDHRDAVAAEPLGEELVLHRHLGADEAHGRRVLREAGLGDDVGEVEQRDVDGGLDLVGDLVERRGAQQQEVGAGPLDAATGVGEQLADLVPALALLEVGQLGEVDRAQHQPRRRQPAQPLLHAEVEVAVVDRAALPAHAPDEADGLHEPKSARNAGAVR